MNIHGFNLILLLLPWLFFLAAYKTKKFRAPFAVLGLLVLVAMPFKLVNSPNMERGRQDSVTFDSHQELAGRVVVQKPNYVERMKKRDAEIQAHSEQKFKSIMGENK